MMEAPEFAKAVYEAFYRDLISPLGSKPSLRTLSFKDDILSRPSISGKNPPIFVIGLARSGTSILQRLLSMDPNARTPLNWEFHTPSSFLSKEDRIKRFGGLEPSNHPRELEMAADHPAEDTELSQLCGGAGFMPEGQVGQEWSTWTMSKRDVVAFFCAHRMVVRLLEKQSSPPSSHWVCSKTHPIWDVI